MGIKESIRICWGVGEVVKERDRWEKSIPRPGNSRCKGKEARNGLICLGNIQHRS